MYEHKNKNSTRWLLLLNKGQINRNTHTWPELSNLLRNCNQAKTDNAKNYSVVYSLSIEQSILLYCYMLFH